MKRYFVDSDWTAKKLECTVVAPDSLNLEHLRSQGLQAGEEEMVDEPAGAAAGAAADAGATADAGADPVGPPQPDDTIVVALVSMGFSENGSKRAALAVNNRSETLLESGLTYLPI
jgi:ubiquitin carboxyl-terminal hydrolase 5/13